MEAFSTSLDEDRNCGKGLPAFHKERRTYEKDGVHSQWRYPLLHRRPRDAAVMVSARRTAPDRHQIRLRQGALRGLHGADRRRGGAQLRHADEERGGKEDRDHRGLERQGGSSAAEGLGRVQRAAVRLLPERPAHAGGGAAQGEAEADRRRDRRGHAGEYLPLRHLSAHPPGNQAGSGGEIMSGVVRVSRRGFLKTTFSAGALILCARFFPGTALDALAKTQGWFPGVYLGIEPNGTVIIIAHRSEMGTGIRTALPMVAADELDADWQRVRIEQAIGDARFGDQNTDGSKSIRDFYDP